MRCSRRFLLLLFLLQGLSHEGVSSDKLPESTSSSASLFMTSQEAKSLKGEDSSNQNILESVTLDAILFHTPEVWTLWINGVRVSSDAPTALPAKLSNISVQDVDAQGAILEISTDQGTPYVLKLKPGQTFSLKEKMSF